MMLPSPDGNGWKCLFGSSRRKRAVACWLVVITGVGLVLPWTMAPQAWASALGPPPVIAAEGAEAPSTMFDYFLAGGILMWPILLCSLVALAVVLERMVDLRRSKVVDDHLHAQILQLVEDEGTERAMARAEADSLPMSKVLTSVLRCANTSEADMGAMLEDAGARELWQLRRNAKPLGIVSNVAPLLGLLGTVFGIIRAFEDVAAQEAAVGNSRMLATGVYEALITTAAGLCVAIPAFAFYHYFQNKADALVRDVEEKALALISIIIQVRSRRADAEL